VQGHRDLIDQSIKRESKVRARVRRVRVLVYVVFGQERSPPVKALLEANPGLGAVDASNAALIWSLLLADEVTLRACDYLYGSWFSGTYEADLAELGRRIEIFESYLSEMHGIAAEV
jgi:hypothetical protein